MGKDQHVMFHDNRWVVKGEGDAHYSSSHKTQKEAIEKARDISRRQHSEMLVHKKDDNTIRMRNSYGNDPRNIKG